MKGQDTTTSDIHAQILDSIKRFRFSPHPGGPRLKKEKFLIELSLYDSHINKLCWNAETDNDYDLTIATTLIHNAIIDLLDAVSHLPAAKLIFVLGNDFFNTDNLKSETTAGTRVDSTDDRFTKIFDAGLSAISAAIDLMAKQCNVHCLWLPGNHDYTTSYYLARAMECLFRRDKRVTFDLAPTTRKYIRWNRILLGYTHGAKSTSPRDADLPLVMATERPVDWGESHERAWRVGHLHKRSTMTKAYLSEMFNGTRVDHLPSLCGVDKWHFDHGFIGSGRTAEAWVWRPDSYYGHFSTKARLD